MRSHKILVLGLGNTLISDDGIGIYIIRELKERLKFWQHQLDFVESSTGGIRLLDELSGYKMAIIVDSIITGTVTPGEAIIYELNTQQLLPKQLHRTTGHTLTLPEVLLLGKELGYNMPESILIFAIEIKDNLTIKEELSSELSLKFDNLVYNLQQKISEILNTKFAD